MNTYCDIPEAIEYGENFIVHREGPEATPYLPNVIVSSNPLIRPEDYGIPRDELDAEKRTVRNVRLPWAEVKKTKNPLWEQGFQFYCLTPKTRHTVHSCWAVTDWNVIWASNFGDPRRVDKRQPGVGDHQVHMNPQAARDLGLDDGDYVYVDANPADRPYVGYEDDPKDPFYKVARLMLRVKYNPAYPYNTVMTKHGTFIATEKTVKAHETRAGRPRGVGRHGLPVELPLRVAAEHHAGLGDADAPDRHAVPQEEDRHVVHVRRRGRQPRDQHGAEGDARARHEGGRRAGSAARAYGCRARAACRPAARTTFMQRYLDGGVVKTRG